MTWAGWCVLSYLAISAWVSLAIYLHESPTTICTGKAARSGWFAIVIMWVVPALFFVSLLFGARGQRN